MGTMKITALYFSFLTHFFFLFNQLLSFMVLLVLDSIAFNVVKIVDALHNVMTTTVGTMTMTGETGTQYQAYHFLSNIPEIALSK